MSLLAQELQTRIRSRGPLTFRDFMDCALYDPEGGYYNTQRLKIGPAGDYYTSSNVHAAFGASLAQLFSDLLSRLDAQGAGPTRALDAPEHYRILEVGAGTGQLAHDVLSALFVEHPQVYARIEYVIAERSPAMEQRQREKLGDYAEKVEWAGVTGQGHPRVESTGGLIFSNELIDALPVHVVRAAADGLEELYVTCDGRSASISKSDSSSASLPPGGFRFSWGSVSSQSLEQYIDRMNVPLSVGQVVEVNLDGVNWLLAVARVLNSGYLVTIDYGDIAQHLYGPDRRRGTLRAFREHTIAASVLEHAGEQDITSSVNFTALMEYGRDAGLETVSFERQSAFLVRLGLIDRLARVEMHADVVTDVKNRLAIKNLFVPGGASDNFRVLIQRKVSP
jgi:SAM-dependent MidA family methyltransferase